MRRRTNKPNSRIPIRSIMRIYVLPLLCVLIPACSFFGGFDEKSAPPAYPVEMVSQLTLTPGFAERPIRTLHAQSFDVLHFGDVEDMEAFALVSQPENKLVAFGLDGDDDDPEITALYDYLLDKCRQISEISVGGEDYMSYTVRCGRQFVAGLEKVSDGSIAITFLDSIEDHQRVSVQLNEMNRRAQGIRGEQFRASISIDWAAESSVPLQPGAASIAAPEGKVWFGVDYLVENVSDTEAAFHPGDVSVVDRQDQTWEANDDATARSNGGLNEFVLPARQKIRVRTLVAVPPDIANLGFRVHLEDLGETGWFIGYRTVNHVSTEPDADSEAAGERNANPENTAEAGASEVDGQSDEAVDESPPVQGNQTGDVTSDAGATSVDGESP